MHWKNASMIEAVTFMVTKTDPQPVEWKDLHPSFYNPGSSFASIVRFADGSMVACSSEWSGPYSEVTPDIDADDPIFYIYDPQAPHER